jgi:hypothetical protein
LHFFLTATQVLAGVVSAGYLREESPVVVIMTSPATGVLLAGNHRLCLAFLLATAHLGVKINKDGNRSNDDDFMNQSWPIFTTFLANNM